MTKTPTLDRGFLITNLIVLVWVQLLCNVDVIYFQSLRWF
jgi:hypothetical protein